MDGKPIWRRDRGGIPEGGGLQAEKEGWVGLGEGLGVDGVKCILFEGGR